MSAADTGVRPILDSSTPLRPPMRRRHPDRRAQVVRQVLAVIGSTRWGSPPPGVSMRQALLRVLLTTVALALLLLGGR
jgi:hypothetical protein